MNKIVNPKKLHRFITPVVSMNHEILRNTNNEFYYMYNVYTELKVHVQMYMANRTVHNTRTVEIKRESRADRNAEFYFPKSQFTPRNHRRTRVVIIQNN